MFPHCFYRWCHTHLRPIHFYSRHRIDNLISIYWLLCVPLHLMLKIKLNYSHCQQCPSLPVDWIGLTRRGPSEDIIIQSMNSEHINNLKYLTHVFNLISYN